MNLLRIFSGLNLLINKEYLISLFVLFNINPNNSIFLSKQLSVLVIKLKLGRQIGKHH